MEAANRAQAVDAPSGGNRKPLALARCEVLRECEEHIQGHGSGLRGLDKKDKQHKKKNT